MKALLTNIKFVNLKLSISNYDNFKLFFIYKFFWFKLIISNTLNCFKILFENRKHDFIDTINMLIVI